MGCPDKTVVGNGTCSALINNRSLALEIIKATQEGAGGKLPISIKTRLGFSDVDFSWHELLLHQDLAMMAVHGRTRKEMSKVPAHWEQIGEIRILRDKVAPKTKIVGNGDVTSRGHGLVLAEKYELDGVMIGRGIFQDPFVFAEPSPWVGYTKEQKVTLFTQQVKLFAKTWQNGERALAPLNKFCKIYISGFDGAKELRERLMDAHSTDELLARLRNA
jgi:tRNA-dihydrouridine synthase